MSYNSYSPARHTLVDVEVMPSTNRKGVVTGWFARLTYTGNPITDFRGTRCEVEVFPTEAEAQAFAAQHTAEEAPTS